MKLSRILITGPTGNIGKEVVISLLEIDSELEIIAGVRNIEKAKKVFNGAPKLQYRQFDFDKSDTFLKAFSEVDILFLLRPPHISDVDKVFRPLLKTAKENGINQIIFLSVQGAERSKVIPHNKIERLIQSLAFKYIFIRPSYFMQNLTTALLPEIVNNRSITLPSGNAKFNWIDVKDIGEVSARLIVEFKKYQNNAFEITGTENKSFSEVANLMTEITGEKIKYRSINPIRFYFRKRKEGIKSDFALVMTILHFLPRLQSEPDISNSYQKIIGKAPTTLSEFIEREKHQFANQ